MRRLPLFVMIAALAAGPSRAATPTTKELLRYVPPSAAIVVAMDAAALRSHPLVQTWLLDHQASWSGAHSDAQDFLREAGLDPLRDVDRMVVAVVRGPGSDRGLAIFAGRFDPTSLTAALIQHGGEQVKVGTVTAIRLQNAEHPQPNAPLLFVTPNIAIAGDEASLLLALGGTPQANALVDAEVAAGRLDLNAPFWAVASVPPQSRERVAARAETVGADAQVPFGDVLAASHTILRVTLQASLDDQLSLVGSAAADSVEDAELLRDAVKGAIAAARLHVQDQNPELVDVLRGITISVDGSEVRGTAAVPVALIEKLASEHRRERAEHVHAVRTN